MPPVINQYTFLFLIGSLLSMVVGIVLVPLSYRKNLSNNWLAAYFITAGYGLLIAFLLYARLISISPWFHLYRTGYIAGFILMPVSFLYIRNLLRQTRFKPVDLIHFIPVLIFMVDMFPFYLSSPTIKLEQVLADEKVLNTGWRAFSQGWLGIGFIYLPLRVILSTIYWFLQVRIVWQSNQVRSGETLINENKTIIRWAKIFCALQVLIFIPYYLTILIGAKNVLYVVSHGFVALSCTFSMIALMLNPEIMYGLKGVLVKSPEKAGDEVYEPGISLPGKSISHQAGKAIDLMPVEMEEFGENMAFELTVRPRQMNYVSREKLERINLLMLDFLQTEQSYLKKGYSSGQLAADIGIQPYLISAVINQLHQTNYNDFINSYRITQVVALMEKGEGKLLTLEAIAGACGFNNRNSFTTAFKKHTGTTPGAYARTRLQNIDI